jgi:hypothetical protein
MATNQLQSYPVSPCPMIETAKVLPLFETIMDQFSLVIKRKTNYGSEVLYIADEKLESIIQSLTHKKTVSEQDITAIVCFAAFLGVIINIEYK